MTDLYLRINQYWRVVATGIGFALFGLGGLFLSAILLPVALIFVTDKRQHAYRVQRLIQRCFSLFFKLLKLLGALDYKVTNAHLLQQDKGCLIVANHPSLLDYVLIASQLPQCDCIVKSALWHNPFLKHVVQAAGYIPNSSADELFSLCEEKLADGNVLLIFPEGTRSTPEIASKIQRGAAQIAVRSQADMRVIHITVEPLFLTKQSKWYQVPKKKPFFHLQVQGKIAIKPFLQATDSVTIAARRVNSSLQETIFPK